ncbi:MAG TPA: hypothetical protein VNV65_06935 [Candidatus Solibacter sp.]|jgi:hypothetical protein|nr:hypothetical protein [Candidatus Solibacter sp.]
MAEARAAELKVAHVGGIDVLLTPAWAAGTVVLIVFFAAIGRYVFHHGFAGAVAGAIVLTAGHWVSEVVHNLGHSTAARRTGHPMTATRLGFLLFLGVSIYPEDEPELPSEVHIRRALGGPVGSALLTLALGVVALVTSGTSLGWVALVWFLDNLLIFTLGAFVPVGFNDGSTLIRWIGRRRGGA